LKLHADTEHDNRNHNTSDDNDENDYNQLEQDVSGDEGEGR